MNKIFLVAILIIFTALNSGLQSQTRICDIKLKDGKMLNRKRMVGLHDNFLLVSDTGSYKIVNIEKVSNVRFDNGTYMWTGVGIGAATGFIAGFVYYNFFNGAKKKSFLPKDATVGTMFVFTIPCAIIGGLVGLLFRNIDDYDLSKLNTFTKSKELKFIMTDHEAYR
jgi:hypothetical protein